MFNDGTRHCAGSKWYNDGRQTREQPRVSLPSFVYLRSTIKPNLFDAKLTWSEDGTTEDLLPEM